MQLRLLAKQLLEIDDELEKVKPESESLFWVIQTHVCQQFQLNVEKYQFSIWKRVKSQACFDQRVPEETNRRIVDHIADTNMPYSSIAREHLIG